MADKLTRISLPDFQNKVEIPTNASIVDVEHTESGVEVLVRMHEDVYEEYHGK